MTPAAIDAWYRSDAPPERLAALRLLVGGFATVYLAARVVHLISFVDFAPPSFAPAGVGRPLLGAALTMADVVPPVAVPPHNDAAYFWCLAVAPARAKVAPKVKVPRRR